MSILLKSLPPIVVGVDYARILQGVNEDGTVPTATSPGPFTSSDTLSATLSPGQGLPSLFAPTVSWFNAPLNQFLLTIAAVQSATLAADNSYLVEVFVGRSGLTYPIAVAYLPVLPSAGAQAAAVPADLVTIPYAARMLAQQSLAEPQLEMIPTLITSASAAVRLWCNQAIGQATYTKEFPVIEGWVRLDQVPVNQVIRLQADPATALTITNTSAQSAQVLFAYIGAVATGNQAITGLSLSSTLNGVVSTNPIAFTPSMTINAVAVAINAVGSGWSAAADSALGAWPASELIGGLIARDAAQGAELAVYSRDLSGCRFHPDDGQLTGMLWVGRRSNGLGRWGPNLLSSDLDDRDDSDMVRITYNAGYPTIPGPVQLATIGLVLAGLQHLAVDGTLSSESAGDYSYTLKEMIPALPFAVRQGLAMYRITNA